MLAFALSALGSATPWGPAAWAEDDDVPTPEEIENTADAGGLPSTDDDRPDDVVKPVKKSKAKAKPKAKPKTKPKAKAKPPAKRPSPKPVAKKAPVKTSKKAVSKSQKDDESIDEDDEEVSDETAEEEAAEPEERDPVKMSANAKELAIRSVGLAKIQVTRDARKYVPAGTEARLSERLLQDLKSKTYFEPKALDGAVDLRSRSGTISSAAKKASVDGVLILEIGLEEILGSLSTISGQKVKGFEFRYKVGELEEKNAVSVLSDRIIEGIVQVTPYRGFLTSVSRATATVNLGSDHSIKEGDVLELFEFRRPNMNSTRRLISEVVVKKVDGPTESTVGPIEGRSFIVEPFAKVSYSISKTMAVEATDHSVVSGRWWMGFGGQLVSFGAEAAAPKYESRLFKINGSPFGYVTGGNDILTFRGAFGSARSESETLNFFDLEGLYSVYQIGGAQSAWNFSAGGRVLLINVVALPNALTALTSTTIISPMLEAKYSFVPKGRVRLGFTGEVFWPVYTSGADFGALIFAFGGGAGVNMQLAITSQLGVDVFGKLRYLRRPIEGQSGVQERQTLLGAGLVFSF
ncbi:MAG: hypothetical protein U1E10_13975 [Bdellovibrionales bacterium]|nr:hypothetical protein [Bdellovibrionales bacterium]